MVNKTKTFDGKKYSLHGETPAYKIAQKTASYLRDTGMNVRITKRGGNKPPYIHQIWVYKKSGQSKKPAYKEAYSILQEYWDSIPDEEKELLDARLSSAEQAGNFDVAYNEMMEYWDSFPDEEKPDIDRRLKEVGL